MKKMFATLLMLGLTAMPAMAEGFTEGVKQEGATGLIIVAIIFLLILFAAISLIPIGYMVAQKIYKQNSENDRDKMSGVKAIGAGVVGAIAGVLVVYFFFGTIGSYLNPTMNGEVDFDKGTAYIFSHYIGTALDKALGII